MRSPSIPALASMIVLVGTLVALGACQDALVHDVGILSDLPCPAPCWQGLTPGASTLEDAREVLDGLGGSLVGGYSEQQLHGETVLIQWHFRECQYCAVNGISLDNGVVSTISMFVPYNVPVADLLAGYGEPEGIVAFEDGLPEHRYVAVSMFYGQRGLTFVLELPTDRPMLDPTSRVMHASYSEPYTLSSKQEALGDEQALTPWPGYGNALSLSDPLP